MSRVSLSCGETMGVSSSSYEVVGILRAAAEKGDTQLVHLIWLAMWTGCRIEDALLTDDRERP
nr:hypothetical protein DWF04_18530 [Cereibacter sphaeroides f. sp. denitrificans]